MLKSTSGPTLKKALKKAKKAKTETAFTGRPKDKNRSPEEVAARKAQIDGYERGVKRHNG
jgi:hypothetical protein